MICAKSEDVWILSDATKYTPMVWDAAESTPMSKHHSPLHHEKQLWYMWDFNSLWM